MGSFLFGYHMGVVNAPMGVIANTLGFAGSAAKCGQVVSATLVGAFVGSLSGGSLADGFGRRATFTADAAVLAFALQDAVDPVQTFTTVVLGFAPVQLPLVLLEAAISLGLVRRIAARRPDLLPETLRALRPTRVSGVASLLLLLWL